MLKKKNQINIKLTQKQRKLQQNRNIELGGPQGLEPTRYGDWEVKGRVSDF